MATTLHTVYVVEGQPLDILFVPQIVYSNYTYYYQTLDTGLAIADLDYAITLGGTETGDAAPVLLTFMTLNDTLAEPLESYSIIISGETYDSTGAGLPVLSYTDIYNVIIIDDDGPSPYPFTTGDDDVTLTLPGLVSFALDGNDRVTGTSADDIILGEGGNDILDGGAGSDLIFGGAGQDQINLTDRSVGDVDVFDGGADRDRLDVSGLVGSSVWMDLGYNLPSGTNLFTLDGTARVLNIETVVGTSFADVLRGDSDSNEILGGGGDDIILGYSPYDTVNPYASLGDVLSGGGGNDTIYSGTGNDFIDGGDGDDVLEVGGGTDTVVGGAGNDIIFFSPRNGANTVVDFEGGAGTGAGHGDVLKLYGLGEGYDSFLEVFNASAQVGNDTLITFAGQNTTILLQNFARANLVADDVMFV